MKEREPSQRQRGSARTIIIIEDEGDVLLVYRDYLIKKGFSVVASAPTADEVLRDYKTYRPGLVIMDYKLPGSMNGLEAAERILREDGSAKVLIVSAHEKAARELGSNAFLKGRDVVLMKKPLHLAELARAVSGILPPEKQRPPAQ